METFIEETPGSVAPPLGKNIRYDYQKGEDKYAFGGYFNLANNNITSAFILFKKRFSLICDDDARKILEVGFSPSISYTEWEYRIEFLSQYLPVTKRLNKPINHQLFDSSPVVQRDSKRRELFTRQLGSLLKLANSLRNFYTHFKHAQISADNETIELLDDLLLNVCKEVKKKRKANDKTRQLLSGQLREEYQALVSAKKQELIKLKDEGKKVNVDDPEEIHNAVMNDAFKHMLFKEKEKGEVSLSKYNKTNAGDLSSTENKIPLSKNGLVFFLSMFLTKKQGEDFRSRITGFKGKSGEQEKLNSLRNMATHWIYSYLAYRESRPKITTSFGKETLLAQIVDELSKVPDELYQTLTQKDKAEFLEDMNEYVKDGNETESLADSIVIHPVIRKRYEDKFYYFAVRFLDEFANFPTLRFQVHLGNYVHDRRTKLIEGTKFQTERVVKEQVHVFGKLSEIAKSKNDYWEANPPEGTQWERFPNPSYRFVGNNIPIHLRPDDEVVPDSYRTLLSDLRQIKSQRNKEEDRKQRSSGKSTEQTIIEAIIKTKPIMGEPTALFNMKELPALLYQFLVLKKTGEELEKVLIEKLTLHVKEIQNFEEGTKASASRISKKMILAKGEDYVDLEKLEKRFKKEIAEAEGHLQLVRKKIEEAREEERSKRKKRKLIFRNSEKGEIATWLTADFIRFMPEAVRKNWRGHHHSQLQYMIAFYENCRLEAEALVKSFWNMDNWDGRFSQLFHPASFDEFYTKYITSTMEVFETFKMQVEQHRGNPKVLSKVLKEVWSLLPKREFTIHNLAKQKTALLAKPLVFPRGIFEDKPTFIKDKKPDSDPTLFADWYIYALGKQHGSQKFYDLHRDYKDLLASEKLHDPDFTKNKKKLSDAEQQALLRMKQDLKIKNVRMRDVFLKDVATNMTQKILGTAPTFTLTDFYQTQLERKQNAATAVEQSERKPGDSSQNIHNESFIWGKTFPFANGQLKEEKVKLKDIGKYNRYVQDEKVKVLFSYDPSRTWTRQQLLDELELKPTSYEVIRREQLLKEVQLLEEWIEQHSGAKSEQLMNYGHPSFKHYVVNGLLARHSIDSGILNQLLKLDFGKASALELNGKNETVQKAMLLIVIRNKFAHNQLPQQDWLVAATRLCPLRGTYSEFYLQVFMKLAQDLKASI